MARPAPLTPEYQAIYEANLKDQEAGGHGDTPTVTCLPPGMPRQMNVYEPMQIVITPQMVHILIEHVHDSRRIYTDGRDWPKEMEPMFSGYSIGKWIDADGDGRYDTLDGRDSRAQGAAHLRHHRRSHAQGRPDRRQGTPLSRTRRTRTSFTTRSRPSTTR